MRIVFMGTPDFAVTTLRALIGSGHEVVAAVSQPDKPFGRKAELRPTPVRAAAEAEGIPVLQPRRLRDPEFTEKLEQLDPDVIVVAAYGKIIPGFILELPKYGCLNVHASLLPKYRGAAPIQWAILDGETETGISIMQMNEGLDTGDILNISRVAITDTETGGSLFDKLAAEGGRLLVDTLKLLEAGQIRPEKQPADSPTPYARMIVKEDGLIDWKRSAAEIERQVRALDPWPGAYTRLNGKLFKVLRSHVPAWNETNDPQYDRIGNGRMPGCVLSAGSGGIDICTGDGVLRVTEVQLEGKKRMEAADFLRGRPMEQGLVLG